MADHYQVLGVERAADAATIKAAYRKLAAVHHPDKGGDVQQFQAIQAAYATLSDPDKRAYYDRTGSDAPRASSELEELAPLVVGAFDRAIVEVLKGGAMPAMPPGTWPTPRKKGLGGTDIVASMVRLLESDKARGEEANKQLAHEAEQMREMQRRLGWKGDAGKDIIAFALAQRLRDADDQTAKNTATIGLVERAIKHVHLYGWEMDPPREMPTFRWAMKERDLYDHVCEQMMLKAFGTGALGEAYRSKRIPTMFPGTRIKLAPATPKRRMAVKQPTTGLYHRPHTCTLDAEGKQVPRPRGSWAEFERRVKEVA